LEGLAKEEFGVFCVHLVYFTAICYILCPSGMFDGYLVFFPVLVCCTKKNLATLLHSTKWSVVFDIIEIRFDICT
jgi:hypothetical protein